MRFLLDQSSDAPLAAHLISRGHDAVRVGHEHPGGLADSDVLAVALREHRVLITDDRDFGNPVFRLKQPHTGVIYFRLGDYTSLATKVERLDFILERYAEHIYQFIVCTPHRLRVRRS